MIKLDRIQKSGKQLNLGLFFFMILSITISLLTLISTEVNATSTWGCCADTVTGCRNVYTTAQIQDCVNSHYAFEGDKSCFPIASNPGLNITTNPVCNQVGCCCFNDGTFSARVTGQACLSLSGTLKQGTDCGVVCNSVVPINTTCASLGGSWCNSTSKAAGAIAITGITDYSGKPGTEYTCYNLQCTTPANNCQKGNSSYEIYCLDGINNDQDCSTDVADTDCQNSVGGFVKNQYGIGISNVKIKIVNKLANVFGKDEIFYTYSSGNLGTLFYQGLSKGNYDVFVDDPIYTNTNSISGFTIDENTKFISGIQITVVQKNSYKLKGNVVSNNGSAVVGALVVLDNSEYSAYTNSTGGFVIENVKAGNYFGIAYKTEYISSIRTPTSVGLGKENYLALQLRTGDCSTSPSAPKISSINNVKGKTDIILNFNSNNCTPNSYTIYRCNKAIGLCSNSSEYTPVANAGAGVISYLDSGLFWNTTYNYIVLANYGTGSSMKSVASLPASINTGNENCNGVINFNKHCNYNFITLSGTKTLSSSTVFYCNANNSITTVGSCTNNSKCTEDPSISGTDTAYCRQIDNCSPLSNNYFGLFFGNNFNNNACQGQSNQKFCALDNSITNVNACNNCKDYTTCVDYKTENACNVNNCGLGSCEWKTTDSTLKLGICIDKIKSNCDSCTDVFNRVFGSCNSDVCNSLGNCSFSKTSGACNSCSATSCYDYDGANSCGNSPYGAINLKTNAVIIAQDTCKIGVCAWNPTVSDGTCFKDADADGRDDCESASIIFGANGTNAYTQDYCKKDVLPPETKILLNKKSFNPSGPMNGKITATFNSLDRVSNSDAFRTKIFGVKEVYFCIDDVAGNYCKNTKQNYNTVPKVDGNYQIDISGGTYVALGIGSNKYYLKSGTNILKYYAKDYANNMEIVKSEEFYVDTFPPALNVSFVKFPDMVSGTSDVSIFVEADEDVYCYSEQADCNVYGNCDNNKFTGNITEAFLQAKAQQFAKTYTREVFGLEDGTYLVKTVCVDKSGNVNNKTSVLSINVDSRIFDGVPNGAINYTNVILKVKTASNVQCKYGTSISANFNTMQNLMTKKAVDTYYEHTAQIVVSGNSVQNYYVRCNYDPVAMEKISFVVDNIKPSVKAILNGIEIGDGATWTQNANLELRCSDSPEFGFGCNQTYYCTSDIVNFNNLQNVVSCTPTTTYVGPLNISSPKTVCFYSVENIRSVDNKIVGGLSSGIICRNILTSDSEPILSINNISNTTNRNSILIGGGVRSNLPGNKKLFFKINSELIKTVDTLSNFSFQTTLTRGTPVHGNKYELTMYAQDVSGKQSESYSKIITYDLSGPEVKDLKVQTLSTGDNYGSNMEFGYRGQIRLTAEDDYSGVSKVLVEIEGIQSELKFNALNGKWEGAINSQDLPIGNFTPKITLYDGLGNINVVYLTDAVEIIDAINPAFTINLKRQYFNTDAPFIDINTSVLTSCSIKYTAKNNINYSHLFSTSYSKDFSVQVKSQLYSDVDDEVKNIIRVDCVDRNGSKVARMFNTFVDLKKPVYFAGISSLSAEKVITMRNEIDYLGLKAEDYLLYFKSDEPVNCRYAKSNELSSNGYGYNYTLRNFIRNFTNSRDTNYIVNDVSDGIYLQDKTSYDYKILCEDRAGNQGNIKTIKISVDSDSRPYLFNLDEKHIINNNNSNSNNNALQGINFYTARPTECTYSINSSEIKNLEHKNISQNIYEYTVNTSDIISNYADGTYELRVLCKKQNTTNAFYTVRSSIIKDTISPILISANGKLTDKTSTENVLPYFNEDKKEIINTAGGIINFSFITNEDTNVAIYNNNVLTAISSKGKNLNLEIPLIYGLNDLEIAVIDIAGNYISTRVPVISSRNTPDIKLSELLDNSLSNSYQGNIKSNVALNTPNIKLKYAQKEITIPITLIPNSLIPNSGVNNYYYNISFSKNILYSLIDNNNNNNNNNGSINNSANNLSGLSSFDWQYSKNNSAYNQNLIDPKVSNIISLELYDAGQKIQTEVFLYSPFSESLKIYSPSYKDISNGEISNYNEIKISGKVNNDNYIIGGRYSVETTNSQNKISPIMVLAKIISEGRGFKTFKFNNAVLQELNINQNKYSVSIPYLDSGYLYLELLNDLGTSVIKSTFFRTEKNSPYPTITIFPGGGDTAYSNRPQFLVENSVLGRIKTAYVSNFDLSKNYSVSGIDPQFNFRDIIIQNDALDGENVYYLNVIIEDSKGNLVEKQFAFIFSVADFNLYLKTPKYGVMTSNNQNVYLESNMPAMCKYAYSDKPYSNMTNVTNYYSSKHRFITNITTRENVYIRCDAYADSTNKLFNYTLEIDNIAPQITSITIDNAKSKSGGFLITEYPLEAQVKINTNKLAYCRYDISKNEAGLKTTFANMRDVAISECVGIQDGNFCFNTQSNIKIPNLQDKTKYYLQTICQGKSELNSSIAKRTIEVDLGKDSINIISPNTYESNLRIDVVVETKNNAEYCAISSGNSTQFSNLTKVSDKRFNSSISFTTTGQKSITISCKVGEEIYNRTKIFTIDNTVPLRGYIVHANSTTINYSLSAKAENFSDPESDIERYEFAIGTAPFGQDNWNSVLNWTSSSSSNLVANNLNLARKTTFYWSVRVLNKANLYSVPISSAGIYVENVSVIVESVPSCRNGIKDANETGVDCGEKCNKECPEGTLCQYDDDCFSIALTCTNNECSYRNSGGGSHTTACTDGIKDGNETGVDCGESCNKECPEGTICEFDVDCFSANLKCSNNLCSKSDNNIFINRTLDEPDISINNNSSNWWIYLIILLIGILIIAVVLAYYFLIYKKKDDETNISNYGNMNGTTGMNTTTPNMSNRVNPADQNRPNVSINNKGNNSNNNAPNVPISNVPIYAEPEERKEDLIKRILEKKLIEERKKKGNQEREGRFNLFESKKRFSDGNSAYGSGNKVSTSSSAEQPKRVVKEEIKPKVQETIYKSNDAEKDIKTAVKKEIITEKDNLAKLKEDKNNSLNGIRGLKKKNQEVTKNTKSSSNKKR